MSMGKKDSLAGVQALRPAGAQALRERARRHIEQGAVTSGYGADREAVLKLLNDSLATEIVCVLRYRRHHFMARGRSMPTSSPICLRAAIRDAWARRFPGSLLVDAVSARPRSEAAMDADVDLRAEPRAGAAQGEPRRALLRIEMVLEMQQPEPAVQRPGPRPL